MNTNRHTVFNVSYYKPPDSIDVEQTMTTPVKAKQRKRKYLLWDRLPPAPAQRQIQVSRFLMREIISIVQQYFLSSLSLAYSLTCNVSSTVDPTLTCVCT